jgi:hypothetical protein
VQRRRAARRSVALEGRRVTILHPIALRLADTAVPIGGESTMTGTDHGERFSEHFRCADIFQLRDGRWQLVYTQVTMVK